MAVFQFNAFSEILEAPDWVDAHVRAANFVLLSMFGVRREAQAFGGVDRIPVGKNH